MPKLSIRSPEGPILPARGDWLDRVGFFGAAVLLLFFQMNATVAWIGLGLVILAFLGRLRQRLSLLAGDPVVYLWLTLLAYIALSAVLGAREFPETAPEQWKSVRLWSGILFFIPVAFFVGRAPLDLPRVLLLAAGSVVLRIATHFDDTNPFSGERVGFGINPIATALYMGVSALGMLTLAPRMLRASAHPPWLKYLSRILGPILLLLFLEALVLSQSRGGWLAAALVFPPILLLRYRHSLSSVDWRSPRTLGVLVLAVACLFLFAWENAEIISRRVPANTEAVEHAIRGEKADDADASIGFRLLLWQVGITSWWERPLMGWGPGSTETLVQRANIPMLMKAPGKALFSHLHNTYLEILLKFGLVGAGLFAALGLALILPLWRSWQAGILPNDIACLLLGAWAMTAIWAFFEFRFFHYEWRNYAMLLGAVSYSQALLLRQRNPQH